MEKAKIKKIISIIDAFETGTTEIAYDKITILNDGPGKIKQVTLSRGATEFGGALRAIVDSYVKKKGKYSAELAPYVSRIGKKPSLVSDTNFINLLKKSSKEDQLMRDAQDEVYEEKYWNRAYKWFVENKFTLPLSMLVIYDSFIHSGSILSFLRKRFAENVPLNGGDEKEWIKQYVNTRHTWLATHSNKLLQNTVYRTNTFKKLIAANNWNVDGTIRTEHGVTVRDIAVPQTPEAPKPAPVPEPVTPSPKANWFTALLTSIRNYFDLRK